MPKESKTPRVKVVAGARGKFVLRWTADGKLKERATKWSSSEASNRAKAELKARELEQEIFGSADDQTEWESICCRYDKEHLAGLSKKTRIIWGTVKSNVNSIIKPRCASEITSSELSRLASSLRSRNCSENTIATYMRHLLAALRWAQDLDLVEACPKYRITRRAKGRLKTMRSRPVTDQEFERILTAVDRVRKHDPEIWKFYLKGLWWSGLRLKESLSLSWDWSSPVSVDLNCDVPRYVIWAEGQKSHRDEILPIAPEFVGLLKAIPSAERNGAVFKLPCSEFRVVRNISAIGREANVVVSPCGKTATAHDFRRSFGTRWASKLTPAELKVLMRHASIDTTMKFYVQLEADQLGKKLWASCDSAKPPANGSAHRSKTG